MPDKEYKLAEYQALRDVALKHNDLVTSALNFSVAVVVTMVGFLFQIKTGELRFVLFFAPFVIMLPSLYIMLARNDAQERIAAYIIVFLDEVGGLRYETRWDKFQDSPTWKLRRRLLNIGPTYREAVFLLYAGLGSVVIGLFVMRGSVAWYHLLFYCGIAALYLHVFYTMLIWRRRRTSYMSEWKRIKESEEAKKQPRQSPWFSQSSADNDTGVG